LLDQGGDAVRDLDTARWNSGQNEGSQIRVPLDDLVRKPAKRAANGGSIHDRRSRPG
jgi:hypothetical protein